MYLRKKGCFKSDIHGVRTTVGSLKTIRKKKTIIKRKLKIETLKNVY